MRFQCHHGVPASFRPLQEVWLLGLVSMPPRRSCFDSASVGFHCRRRRFNATTAFLLRFSKPYSSPSRLWVSMPPRRSCFGGPVPPAGCLDRVSMPPRRSCFRRQLLPVQPQDGRFNATTAFLLQVRENTISRPIVGFNATTAFLLRMRLPSWSSGAQCFNATTAFLLRSRGGGGMMASILVSMPPRRSCFWIEPTATWGRVA